MASSRRTTAGNGADASEIDPIDEETQSGESATGYADDEPRRARRRSVVRHAPRGLPAAIGRLPRPVMPPRPEVVSRSMEASAEASYFVVRETRGVVATFLDVRGTHLAALIAFYGLLAFFPIALIAIVVLGLFGEQSESSFVIEQLNKRVPRCVGPAAREHRQRVPRPGGLPGSDRRLAPSSGARLASSARSSRHSTWCTACGTARSRGGKRSCS